MYEKLVDGSLFFLFTSLVWILDVLNVKQIWAE